MTETQLFLNRSSAHAFNLLRVHILECKNHERFVFPDARIVHGNAAQAACFVPEEIN
jgi:hypothetical protein